MDRNEQDRARDIAENYHKLDDGRHCGFSLNNHPSLFSTNNPIYQDTDILYELTKGYRTNIFITEKRDQFLRYYNGEIIDYIIKIGTEYNLIRRRVGQIIQQNGRYFVQLNEV